MNLHKPHCMIELVKGTVLHACISSNIVESVAAPGGGARGGKCPPPPNYFLPPHFAPLQNNVLVTESD